MERYQRIAQHKKFVQYITKIRQLEKDRIYCCHDVDHLLDVARIAYIRVLEERIPLSKDLVYGAALLHDIGKVKQYKEKIPHEIAGLKPAEEILSDCGYDKEETALILEAIRCHRRGRKNTKKEAREKAAPLETGQGSDPKWKEKAGHALNRLLYEADKGSRLCMFCQAADSCNWTEEEKNDLVVY